MKRISNDQTAPACCSLCLPPFTAGSRDSLKSGLGDGCNLQSEHTLPSLRFFIMMVYVCDRENDARSFPTLASRFPAECQQLSLTLMPALTFIWFYSHKSCKSTAFPFFVERKRCNAVTLWLSCFCPFLPGTFSIFGNEVKSLVHSATETAAGSKLSLSHDQSSNSDRRTEISISTD